MDPGAIEAMIAAIGVQVANAAAALVPVGVGITLSFIVLGIVLGLYYLNKTKPIDKAPASI